ncbi:uncharacterized [Tachysurus ichikawai]
MATAAQQQPNFRNCAVAVALRAHHLYGIQLRTDCGELRELQMLSALSAPLASLLYSANWPEVKNSLGWQGQE